jgi:HK97 family phage prohead protease
MTDQTALPDTDGAFFAGYASIFNRVDRGRDIVMKGAFARSIRERGKRGIKVLWQHDPREPVGVLEDIHEDDVGLYVKARLLTDVRRAREARALMAAAALDGLSIGYRAVVADRDEKTGMRVLRDVDLWEVSLVTFPMQEAARITSYKSCPPPSPGAWAEVGQALNDLRTRVSACTRSLRQAAAFGVSVP